MNEIDINSVQQSEATRNSNGEGHNANACIICGRETTGTLFALLDESCGYFIPRDEYNEDCGFEPIGSECAKKLPAGFVGDIL
jgi:hypothetical protein